MEFFKLGTDYQPGKTVANFDSLIWTERYSTAGEFKLTVKDNRTIIDVIPPGTLMSHTGTRQVMIAETHEIRRTGGKLEVTISGRSVDTFAEQRSTLGSANPLYNSTTGAANVEVISAKPEDAAVTLLQGRLQPTIASAEDAITGLVVSKSIREPDVVMSHTIKRGDIYASVLELLKICGAGIRSERPLPNAGSTLGLVIHDGLDKTGVVTFYALYRDLVDAQYLFTNRAYKTHAQVAAHTSARLYRSRDLPTDKTGWERRMVYVEANDLEGAYSPPTSTDAVATLGQMVLDASKMISLIQATISPFARPKFKVDYDVGDLVRVFGEFAEGQTMRVTEHILTMDKTGVRGYPSLSAV